MSNAAPQPQPSPDRRDRNDGAPTWSRGIDRCNAGAGRLAGWLVLAMVLLGTFNALARYLGRYIGINLSSNAYLELQWYLFSLVFLLGGAYTLLRDDHVRVDVVFGRLSRRGRALVELAGTLVLLVPFALFVLWLSWPAVRNSWVVLEGSPDPGGLPRYPIRTMILVGFGLLLLQGVARIAGLVAEWRRDGSPRGGLRGAGVPHAVAAGAGDVEGSGSGEPRVEEERAERAADPEPGGRHPAPPSGEAP